MLSEIVHTMPSLILCNTRSFSTLGLAATKQGDLEAAAQAEMATTAARERVVDILSGSFQE